LSFDSAGNLYVSDHLLNQIFRITADGTLSVFAGSGVFGFSGDSIATW
jgi:hypothetical protein